MQGSSIIFGSTKNICQKRIFHNAAMQNFVLTRCMSMKYKIAQIESRSIFNIICKRGLFTVGHYQIQVVWKLLLKLPHRSALSKWHIAWNHLSHGKQLLHNFVAIFQKYKPGANWSKNLNQTQRRIKSMPYEKQLL